MVENWNLANDFILYGRGGEIATNRVEDQEATMLSLHLLQKLNEPFSLVDGVAPGARA